MVLWVGLVWCYGWGCFSRPSRLDVNQRANLERLQSHLRRGVPRGRDSTSPTGAAAGDRSTGGAGAAARFSVWQLGADSTADSRLYDELCDYFIEKQRVGLLEDSSLAIYMVPPNPKYIHPLGVRDKERDRDRERDKETEREAFNDAQTERQTNGDGTETEIDA